MTVMEYVWHSRQGNLTPDNRDYCGISKADGTTLCVFADGATGCPAGGDLAKTLVCRLLEGFLRLSQPASIDGMVGLLLEAHADLRRKHPADSASYIIALMGEGPTVTTLHAGDCRLGRLTNQGSIRWLTPVHTLANAIQELDERALRLSPDRHLLTRSFRAKRFQIPDCVIHEFDERDRGLLIASDGFWADLPEDEQLELLQGIPTGKLSSPDDVSCLFLPLPMGDQGRALLAAQRDASGQRSENLIVATRETGA